MSGGGKSPVHPPSTRLRRKSGRHRARALVPSWERPRSAGHFESTRCAAGRRFPPDRHQRNPEGPAGPIDIRHHVENSGVLVISAHRQARGDTARCTHHRPPHCRLRTVRLRPHQRSHRHKCSNHSAHPGRSNGVAVGRRGHPPEPHHPGNPESRRRIRAVATAPSSHSASRGSCTTASDSRRSDLGYSAHHRRWVAPGPPDIRVWVALLSSIALSIVAGGLTRSMRDQVRFSSQRSTVHGMPSSTCGAMPATQSRSTSHCSAPLQKSPSSQAAWTAGESPRRPLRRSDPLYSSPHHPARSTPARHTRAPSHTSCPLPKRPSSHRASTVS